GVRHGATTVGGTFYRSDARVYIESSCFGPVACQITLSGIGSCAFTLPSSPTSWAETHFEHCFSSVSRMRCSISAGEAILSLSDWLISTTLAERQSKMILCAR